MEKQLAEKSPAEKFSNKLKWRLLQNENRAHPWASFEETRRCRVCKNIFHGRQLRLELDAVSGAWRLRCPTRNCDAPPEQWVPCRRPPFVGETAWSEWVRLLDYLCEAPPMVPTATRQR